MSTQNLKIEYEDGNLVTLEKDGVSLLPLNVTAIHFSHTMKTKPHLKVEIESGGGPYATSPEPAAEPVNTTDTPPPNEGEVLPRTADESQRIRRPRKRNRYNNSSRSE
ncbi:hypothetical protein ACVEIK_025525 (plasmid) [Klebsiella aerogenes]|nr:hypothetical protein [Klebsiella pneumoniae]EKW0455523.1 hypothetical protein [Klebsiella pneumoniae]ELB4096339.1 hypothetical protein [Klebsiella pneumoniae]ELB5502020.1 hypothetical protein [Klebsiella oxytoca]